MTYTTGSFDTSVSARVGIQVNTARIRRGFDVLVETMQRFAEAVAAALRDLSEYLAKWILPLAPQRPKIAYRTPLRVGSPIWPTTVNYRHRGAR